MVVPGSASTGTQCSFPTGILNVYEGRRSGSVGQQGRLGPGQWEKIICSEVLFTMLLERARNVTVTDSGFLSPGQYLLHDRDSKFTVTFDETLRAVGVKAIKLPAQSPNLNAHAERFVLSVKKEWLSRMILFGEASLRRALS
jgi:hypothetical protein